MKKIIVIYYNFRHTFVPHCDPRVTQATIRYDARRYFNVRSKAE